MRIFLDGSFFSQVRRGGICRIFQEVPPRVVEIDPTVQFTLYRRRSLRNAKWPTSAGIEHLNERSMYPWRWFFGKHRVQDYFLNQAYLGDDPDIFHATYFTCPQEIRTPYIVSVYDMIDEIYAPIQRSSRRWRFVEQKRKCLKSADLILSNSDYTTHDLLQYHPVDENKVVTIPLGAGPVFHQIPDENRQKEFLEKHGLARPFFSMWEPEDYNKNFWGLFRAYGGFKFGKEVDLVAVGDDEEFTEEETVFMTSLAPKGKIKHLKIISEDEMVLAYHTALALVFPSLYEGSGLSGIRGYGLRHSGPGFTPFIDSRNRWGCRPIF